MAFSRKLLAIAALATVAMAGFALGSENTARHLTSSDFEEV